MSVDDTVIGEETKQEHLGMTGAEIESIANAVLLPWDAWFYHCCGCGVIHEDKEYTKPLMDLPKLYGQAYIPSSLSDFNITSGICKPCMKENHPRTYERLYNEQE